MKKNVTVIIPAYNEEKTLEEVLGKIVSLQYVFQIIIVDDASLDKTAEIVQKFMKDDRILFLQKKRNEGKTAAIKTALSHVKGDIVVIQDADLEYNPEEIIHLCNPIWNNRADVVYGSRFLVRSESRVLYFYHYLANRTLTFISNFFTNKNMTDIETCYKAFRTELIINMPIISEGFGFEVEVTANICKTKSRIFETPISYYGRTYDEGKKINFKDGLLALFYLFRFNLFPSKDVKGYIKEVDEFIVKKEK